MKKKICALCLSVLCILSLAVPVSAVDFDTASVSAFEAQWSYVIRSLEFSEKFNITGVDFNLGPALKGVLWDLVDSVCNDILFAFSHGAGGTDEDPALRDHFCMPEDALYSRCSNFEVLYNSCFKQYNNSEFQGSAGLIRGMNETFGSDDRGNDIKLDRGRNSDRPRCGLCLVGQHIQPILVRKHKE